MSPLLLTSNIMKLITIFVLVCLSFQPSNAINFIVGGKFGWKIPSSKAMNYYNSWASRNRFRIGDTVYFKYWRDSVLVVSSQEYKSCKSLHPVFFSNSGDTTFVLNRRGLFYFISGSVGHCQKGQKMVIKVMNQVSPSVKQENRNHTAPIHHDDGGGYADDDYDTGAASSMVVLATQVIALLVLVVFLI